MAVYHKITVVNNFLTNSHETLPDQSPAEIPDYITHGFIATNTIISTLSILLNGLIIRYYWSDRKRVVPFLFFTNATNDVFLSIGVILQTIALIFYEERVNMRPAKYFIGFGYITVGIGVRVSAFVNLLVCMVRAVNIIQPFYRVRRRHISLSITVYVAFWTVISFYDVIWFQNKVGFEGTKVYAIRSLMFKPEVGFAVVRGLELSVGGDIVMLFVLPFLLPAFLLTVSTIIQVHKLIEGRWGDKTKAQPKTDTNLNNHAAMTISILSTIYTICNTATVVIWTITYWDILHHSTMKHIPWCQLALLYISGTLMFQVASMVSAVVIVVRGESRFSGFFRGFVRKLSKRKIIKKIVLAD